MVEDVTEVLRRVTEHANGRLFEVFAGVGNEPEGPCQNFRKIPLVRLLGTKPKASKTTEIARFKKI